MYRLLWLGLAGVLCGGFAARPAAAIIINGETEPTDLRYDRFKLGYPSAPVPNDDPSFIYAGYDWSGVGWSPNWPKSSYALLGPRNYLYAAHWPALQWGSTIKFLSTDNFVKTYTIQSESGSLLGDLAVGTFTAPIPQSDNVHYYSILFKGYAVNPSSNQYVGDQLLNYGWNAQIGQNQISRAGKIVSNNAGYYFEYLAVATPGWTKLELYDSCSPSFVTTGTRGEMYLAGAHFAVWPDGSGSLDSALALMLPEISTEMAKTGYLPYVVTPISSQWTGGSSGDWGTTGNWFPGGVPGDTLNGGGKVTTCASLAFNGAATANLTINLGADRTVTGMTFNAATGANGFTFANGNLLTLGEAGIRNLDDDAQTFNCSIKLRSSQRWDIGSGGMNVTGAVNTDAGYLLLIEGPGNATLSGAISGTGGLSKDGLGTLTLGSSSGNTHSGKTFVNGGTLALAHVNALQNSTLDTGLSGAQQVTFTVAGTNTYNLGGLQGADALAIGTNSISVGANGASTVYSGAISGDGALTKVSGGTLTLGGANTYAGITTVSGGRLQFVKQVALYNNDPLKWTDTHIVVNSGATLALNVGGTGEFTATDVATIGALGSGSGGFKNGSILGLDTTGGNFTYGTAIANPNGGTNAIGLIKLGTNTLTLTAANTYTGLTTISAGTLALAHVNALQNSTLNTGPSGAQQVTFTVAGSNTYNLGGLQGADALAIGANTISVGANGASTSYSGVISGIGGALTKVGAGTLTLTAANTYNGNTTVNQGTLALANLNALQNSTLNTGPSGAQQVTFAVAGSNTYNLGGLQGADALAISANTISVGANGASTSYSGVISGTGGALTKTGAGLLLLGGTNSYTGLTTVNGGTVRLANASALGNTAAGTVVVMGELDLNGLTLGNEKLTLNGAGIGGNGALTNSNTLAASLSGDVTLGSGAAIGGSGDIALGGAFDYGSYSLTKTSGNTLTLGGSQTWGNGASAAVQSGTLRYNLDGGQTVAVGAGNTVTIADGATLELAGSQSALSDGNDHVNIANNNTTGTGFVVSGTNQWVGGVSGSGSTIVQDNASLTADYILQDTLTIGAGGSVTIRATTSGLLAESTYGPPGDYSGITNLTDGGSTTSGTLPDASIQPTGGSGGVSVVPEPGLFVLLATAALCLGWRVRRRR